MINRTLFWTMLKMNGKTILGFSVVSTAYLLLVIWIYPTIAGESINHLLQRLPNQLTRLVGLSGGLNSIGDYIAGEFYGLLFLIIMSLYCVMTAVRLISRLVDRGTMAYLLATPHSRSTIVITQAALLVFGALSIIVLTAAGGLIGVPLISPDVDWDVTAFLKMNFIFFVLFFAVSGYCFLFSCLFSDEKKAASAATTVTVLFFLFYLTGKLSEKTDWLLYFTLFSLFEPQKILEGGPIAATAWQLFIPGLLLYAGAIFLFNKRDLSI